MEFFLKERKLAFGILLVGFSMGIPALPSFFYHSFSLSRTPFRCSSQALVSQFPFWLDSNHLLHLSHRGLPVGRSLIRLSHLPIGSPFHSPLGDPLHWRDSLLQRSCGDRFSNVRNFSRLREGFSRKTFSPSIQAFAIPALSPAIEEMLGRHTARQTERQHSLAHREEA